MPTNVNGLATWMKVATIAVGFLATSVASGLSGAYLMGSSRSDTAAAIQQNTECRKDHEQRIRLVESTLSRMDANLEWIREALEK